MDEREAFIALNMMEKVGPVSVRALVSALGSAGAIFDASQAVLVRAEGVGKASAEAICAQRDSVDWRAELERAQALGARIIAQVDADYPPRLREIHDPPLALYVKGRPDGLDRRGIAVVGTRRPTHYGRQTAQKLTGGLAHAGFTVVSGLALGIDTVAHEAALRARGRTIGVIGSGLDCMYPAENTDLAEGIARQGCVMSELRLGRQPDKTTFPMRNRIVSGLSMGVLVVEAGRQSGALITAREALAQGRSVLAVPGRVDSPASQGTHRLLKDGAALVTDVNDILAEFEFLIPPPRGEDKTAPAATAGLSSDEGALVAILQDGEQDVDSLIRGSGLTAARVTVVLLGLEMKKVVRMLPGRVVELSR